MLHGVWWEPVGARNRSVLLWAEGAAAVRKCAVAPSHLSFTGKDDLVAYFRSRTFCSV